MIRVNLDLFYLALLQGLDIIYKITILHKISQVSYSVRPGLNLNASISRLAIVPQRYTALGKPQNKDDGLFLVARPLRPYPPRA